MEKELEGTGTYTISLNKYPKGWRLMEMKLIDKPHGVGWIHALWGFDIWVHRCPLLKVIIATNILMWIL